MSKIPESVFPDPHEGYDSNDLKHQIYDAIKREILVGRLGVGEKLNVVRLAERYNVSRTPVTQALNLLKEDHLIEQIPGKRATVRPLTPQEISTTYLFRKRLEPAAARLSAPVVPLGELQLLEKEILRLQDHPELLDESIRLDERLHSMLWRYLNEPMITSVFRVINEYSVRLQSFTTYSIEGASNNCEEHMRIVAAIRARDPEEAARAAEDHLECSCRRLLSFCRDR